MLLPLMPWLPIELESQYFLHQLLISHDRHGQSEDYLLFTVGTLFMQKFTVASVDAHSMDEIVPKHGPAESDRSE